MNSNEPLHSDEPTGLTSVLTNFAARRARAPWFALGVVSALAVGASGCGTDEDPVPAADTSDETGDSLSGDADDAPDSGGDDDATDAEAELSDTGSTGVRCGTESCAPGEVCFERCLCCGIDTGNPADVRSEYSCVVPDPSCTGTPVECVAEELGCYAFGEWTCSSPCA